MRFFQVCLKCVKNIISAYKMNGLKYLRSQNSVWFLSRKIPTYLSTSTQVLNNFCINDRKKNRTEKKRLRGDFTANHIYFKAFLPEGKFKKKIKTQSIKEKTIEHCGKHQSII